MKNLVLALLVMVNTALIAGCDSDDSPPPPTIVISGTITSAVDGLPIANAQVTLINTLTKQNEVDPVYTNANGTYSFSVPPGSYEVRTAAQGYIASPIDGISGIPVSQTATFDVVLNAIAPGTYGWLNLDLVGYSKTNGALVILQNVFDETQYSFGVTSITGSLMLYNIPTGDYTLTIKAIEHETYTSAANVTISLDAVTAINNITLTATTGYSVSGTVTFLAITNSEVDVSLTDIVSGAIIPGTRVMTEGTNYIINSVAPGDYYIRASYLIDGMVVDPDAIVKQGEPTVNLLAADLTGQDIDVTGAVTLTSPIAAADGSPVEINSLNPTFTWESYPSTSDYVVEVSDIDGTVIWGGFTNAEPPVKVLPISGATTIAYEGPTLEHGKTYRWKIYASKDATNTAGWDLISASEEAQGIFKVVLP